MQSEVVSMPPPPLPQTPMRGCSRWASQTTNYENGRRNSCSAMSISSESSLSNNEEDRQRVEGMLLNSDDPTAFSSGQPEHHWKIPANVQSDTVDTVNAWAPRPYASPSNPVQWPHSVQSSLFEERRQSPHMAPFVSIGPPVSVSASPIDKKSASPSMKGGNNGQGDLASSNDSTPPHSQMPASLSFSPSHYPISELPSVLDEDIIVSPQPKPRENPSIGLSEHTPLSSNPASDPVEPSTPISLSASFDDDDFHMSAQSLSPEIPMIIPTSKDRSGIELQPCAELHSLKAAFRLSGNLGGLDAVETSEFGLDRQSSSVEPGSACAVEPVEASQQTSNSEPPFSVISSTLGSPDDKQLHGTRSSETPVPSVKLVGTSFPTSLRKPL
ncbi:hypothetical protein BDY19DRAFT_379016 [Irpex rosettiformis]|uniref:Uncharacterized protein n=1 Tax=Irpex rosettiformis TaxID=378272 RepID=A0ACB8TVT5_9APHY|nr:hypothetical protein BDY19DRAFT_379016 [Irpex rosettiformis]